MKLAIVVLLAAAVAVVNANDHEEQVLERARHRKGENNLIDHGPEYATHEKEHTDRGNKKTLGHRGEQRWANGDRDQHTLGHRDEQRWRKNNKNRGGNNSNKPLKSSDDQDDIQLQDISFDTEKHNGDRQRKQRERYHDEKENDEARQNKRFNKEKKDKKDKKKQHFKDKQYNAKDQGRKFDKETRKALKRQAKAEMKRALEAGERPEAVLERFTGHQSNVLPKKFYAKFIRKYGRADGANSLDRE